MISDIFFLLFANTVFLFSGFFTTRILGADPEMGLLPRLGLYYMAGLGAISFQMFLFSLLSIPFSVVMISTPWILLTVWAVYRDGAAVKRAGMSMFFQGLGWPEKVFLLVIASQVVYAFVYSPLMLITGWDSWQTWFFKARAFYLDSGVSSVFFKEPLVHPDYPLLIPLSASWIYLCVGEANEQMARVIYPLQFVSLLGIFYHLVKKATSSSNAIFFTALLSLTPVVMLHSAGFPGRVPGFANRDFVGYADLALATYFMAACGFLFAYLSHGRKNHLFLAALFLGIGAWTKDEGLAFALFASIVVVFTYVFSGKRPQLKDILIFLGTVALIAAPWLLYKLFLGIPGEYEGHTNLAEMWRNMGRLPHILISFERYMFELTSVSNFTWYAYFLTTLLSLPALFRRPFIHIHALILAQFSIYVFIYVVTFLDLGFHLATSIDRVVLHLIPMAMFMAAVNYHMLTGRAQTLLKSIRSRRD